MILASLPVSIWISSKKTYTIRFPGVQQFDKNTFHKSFRETFEPYRTRSELIKVLEAVCSSDSADRLLGTLALRAYRTDKVACFVFSNLLRDSNIDIRRLAIIWFSTYLPHPDIIWTDELRPATGDLRKYASFLADCFDRRTIELMLEAVDENGFERGGVGECVWVILVEIPSFKFHLNAIAMDENVSNEVRFGSIDLIGELGLVENDLPP